jgi:flagellar biosynthesis protein FlhA
LLPIAIIVCLLVVLAPLPAALLDLLLLANIALAVIILLTTIYVSAPLEFHVFPTVLLATTLSRLVLNVATTRLVLTRGADLGLDAAGHVVRRFGEFVAGDEVLVGLVVFAIIAVIQFVVITKGATRISEVSARFALDGLPGRQVAVDADLNAGLIDETEAHRRRAEIARQADFYGAMDGASKFVRGDAIASVLITFINIVGGLALGIFQYGMQPFEAVDVFTKLTIGDGLVSQLPAVLISLAAGLLVTRGTQATNLPLEFLRQLTVRPQVLVIAAGFLVLLIATHLPVLPLLTLGGACLCVALMTGRQRPAARQRTPVRSGAPAGATPLESRIEEYLNVEPVELELGLSLVRFADAQRGGNLLARITQLRQSIASELGLVLPKVRIRDNLRLAEDQYRIKIHGDVVATANLSSNRIDATRSGPFDPVAEILHHLRQVVGQRAAELLTRDATKLLIEETRRAAPAVVDELIPHVMKLADVQRILQRLLEEGVSIRQLSRILETLGDEMPRARGDVELTERVRHRLARTICASYRDTRDRLSVVTLEPALEERILSASHVNDRDVTIKWSHQEVDLLCRAIDAELTVLRRQQRPELLLVRPEIRPVVRRLTVAALPQLVVLSYVEVTSETKVVSVGIVGERHHG